MDQDLYKNFLSLESALVDFFTKLKERHVRNANEVGLSVPQFACIWSLSKAGRVKMSDLADILALSYASATNLINKLADAALIIRYDDPQDRRVVYVELSEKGKELTQRIRNKHLKMFEENFPKLTKDEQTYILKGISTLVKFWETF